jgi:hypothetical protein
MQSVVYPKCHGRREPSQDLKSVARLEGYPLHHCSHIPPILPLRVTVDGNKDRTLISITSKYSNLDVVLQCALRH